MRDEADTALIVGVGPGLGAALVRGCAAAGFKVAFAARDAERHDDLVRNVVARGGAARGFPCDATREGEVKTLFDRVEHDFGAPDLVVYNAGAFVPASLLDVTVEDFERCWRVGCLGGFLVGREAARRMLAAGGTIIFTGATASLRGSARFANLAVGKFGLRALAQCMARELGSSGIHVAHVIIDGVIAHPKVGGQTGDQERLDADAIAAAYLMLHRQPKSAWTHELDLRPWSETF